ncbi:DNA topoisomerase IV [Oceanihabitans sp. 2_MG-2023]|uniref:DNA topoisomerase IV n=1 Tax=Oceanihabitans sp. 2_MG-2023 TaxID=3062661 RepID=UPI0026E1F4E5|nr:DNA topoisomerase IV [Oceanihabitans sp. 2_MG-2023]MDO6596797.1 DNA topoisomerase IV [Oceanihabitans sp. 2_MG-2023]
MRYFLFAFIILTFSNCYQVERNCTDFKTGVFYSEVTIDNKVYTSNFTRTKDLQVEVYDGKTDSTQVRWINDCEMIFKTINPKNMAAHKDVHLKILTTTKNSYTFEYSYVGEKTKQKGEAFKK